MSTFQLRHEALHQLDELQVIRRDPLVSNREVFALESQVPDRGHEVREPHQLQLSALHQGHQHTCGWAAARHLLPALPLSQALHYQQVLLQRLKSTWTVAEAYSASRCHDLSCARPGPEVCVLQEVHLHRNPLPRFIMPIETRWAQQEQHEEEYHQNKIDEAQGGVAPQ
eukprot:CAMPEP_0196594744 /NCGR_PEP_ID=MMETSP1081-20130531/79158_1 /TAXON_ID=36882 /ORGANISM="Pyramimonas amylifera, Strain CCMP720" /LENGTH=168 /DNA_ID=CAMNT_0041919091 /DNA_START=305 /DNA_END=811 /DNA_ORIENTATION=-